MVKIYCDRCKEELEGKYYTVSFWEYETNPKYVPDVFCTASSAYSSESRVGALKTLNSQRMYCKKCKGEIEGFIAEVPNENFRND